MEAMTGLVPKEHHGGDPRPGRGRRRAFCVGLADRFVEFAVGWPLLADIRQSDGQECPS
ncbi:hypothetical protein RISK_006348 [Rhodopirellula islandica]|uniref:Uncharacterized protein n=1 Tax=Rhodopirellula islandica TaxID=595434 RepID=A0A0J1B4F6_RHOIS|nr:hypothetical protein RISK_006348 [Rhodopirellula islandica]